MQYWRKTSNEYDDWTPIVVFPSSPNSISFSIYAHANTIRQWWKTLNTIWETVGRQTFMLSAPFTTRCLGGKGVCGLASHHPLVWTLLNLDTPFEAQQTNGYCVRHEWKRYRQPNRNLLNSYRQKYFEWMNGYIRRKIFTKCNSVQCQCLPFLKIVNEN